MFQDQWNFKWSRHLGKGGVCKKITGKLFYGSVAEEVKDTGTFYSGEIKHG